MSTPPSVYSFSVNSSTAISFSMQASDFIKSVEGIIVATVSTHQGFVTIVPERFKIYWAVADADWKTILFSKANSA